MPGGAERERGLGGRAEVDVGAAEEELRGAVVLPTGLVTVKSAAKTTLAHGPGHPAGGV